MQLLKVSQAGKSFHLNLSAIKQIEVWEDIIHLKMQDETLSLPFQDTEDANYNTYGAVHTMLKRSEVFDDPFQ